MVEQHQGIKPSVPEKIAHKNGWIDQEKLLECCFTPLPNWRDALGRYLEALSSRQES